VNSRHDDIVTVATVVAPQQGKSSKMASVFFERGKNLSQNGILNFIFTLNQSCHKVRIYTDEKVIFLKGAWQNGMLHLQGAWHELWEQVE